MSLLIINVVILTLNISEQNGILLLIIQEFGLLFWGDLLKQSRSPVVTEFFSEI